MIENPLPEEGGRPPTRKEHREREAQTTGLISAGESNRGGRATRSVNQDAFFSGTRGFHLGEVGGSIDRPATPEQNVAGMITALNGLDVYTIHGENKETIAILPHDIRQTEQDVAALVKSGKMRGIDVVADGVGGGAHGELASSIVTYIFVREITSAVKEGAQVSDDLLREAVISANDVLRSYNRKHKTASQTSLLAQVTDKSGETRIASVLDSRAYKETADGQVTRLTVDQNRREEAVAAGSHDLLNVEDAVQNKPTRVLGFTEDTPENPLLSRETVQINRTILAPGEKLYLVSDGVSEGYDPDDPSTAGILQRVNGTYLQDLAGGMSQIEARHKAEGTLFKEIHLQNAPDNIQDLARYLTRNEVGHHSKDNVTAVV
ncbi:MAG: protein phosphatase 2C domain-containing protein, partial [Candidatus Levybacteria bacterium]|nr:protein phosphatase 2C domain-containing protein [Candidatus Levybacteria bacterium]